jgi:hypothetical protein
VHLVIRPIAVSLVAGLAFVSAAASGADETFPEVHRDPITIQVLGGKDGRPLGRLHLILIAGYDRTDMRKELFHEDAQTDAHGQVRLSNQMANLPWLQVWVDKKSLCQGNPRIASFSVELMRRDGLSAPNRCGMVTVEDHPGVFTVFVKGKGAAPAPVAIAPKAAQRQSSPATSAPAAVGATAIAPPAAAPCSCSKKARRARSACGRRVFVLPGLALYLR